MTAAHHLRRYCSKRCLKRAEYLRHRVPFREQRNCRFCNVSFTAIRQWQKFCSHACGQGFRTKFYRESGAYDRAVKSGLYRRQYFRLLYGLSLEERDHLISGQGGKCKIHGCLRQAKHVDHDHDTGRVRGILCARDNSILDGNFLTQLWSRAEYLCEGVVS